MKGTFMKIKETREIKGIRMMKETLLVKGIQEVEGNPFR
jgi:hypothetical protein